MQTTSNNALWLFRRLLAICGEQAIALVQIRQRPLTEEVAYDGNDYDFLLNSRDKVRFFTLLQQLASAAALPLFIDQRKREKTVVRLHNGTHGHSIIFEVWYALEVRDPAGRGIDQIWWQDIGDHLQTKDNALVLDSSVEALYYLSHLATKRKQLNNPEVQRRLHHYQLSLQEGDKALDLYRLITTGAGVDECGSAANQLLIEKGILRPREDWPSFIRSHYESLGNRLWKIRMRWLARGNIVAFVGPDGVGKTTLISEYKQHLAGRVKYYRFKKLFRSALLYKALYPLLRFVACKHYRTELEKNQVDDHCGGTLFIIARLRYFTLSLRRLWGTLLLTDRYFHDFLCHGLRFTHEQARPRRGGHWLLHWLPQPRCLVQLDADYAVIASRKSELTESDVGFYRRTIFQLNIDHPAPYYLYLNTARPLAECLGTLAKVSDHIGLSLYDFSAPQSKFSHQDVINLYHATVLGTGHERTCYINPTNEQLCIKISRYRSGDRQQNRVEHYYLGRLAARGVSFEHIPRCHGWVETSAGRGLLLERILNPNGETAPTLRQAMQQGIIDCAAAQPLLDELHDYLQRHAIVFADVCLDNLLLGHNTDGQPRLYIIDGLGARRYGLKLWLHANLKWLVRHKLQKQWRTLQQKFNESCQPSTK
jgi:thymidylate kinase